MGGLKGANPNDGPDDPPGGLPGAANRLLGGELLNWPFGALAEPTEGPAEGGACPLTGAGPDMW